MGPGGLAGVGSITVIDKISGALILPGHKEGSVIAYLDAVLVGQSQANL